MKKKYALRIAVLASELVMALLLAADTLYAQQITGVPGSPDATVTIEGKQLPPPAMPSVVRSRKPPRIPRHGGHRGWCRPRARPTFSSS